MVTPVIKRISPENPIGACRIYIGKGMFTVVDPDDFKRYAHLHVFAKRSSRGWYAVRKHIIAGKTHYIRLHREIACAPYGLQVHHINRNTLDNRKRNLMLVTPADHAHFF